MTSRLGRPPTPPEHQRRGRQAVGVKFSRVEYRELREEAQREGVSVPDLVMERVRGARDD